MRSFCVACLFSALAVPVPANAQSIGEAGPAALPVGVMDYTDVAELAAALQALDASAHAQVITIGYSIDSKTNPSRPVIYPISAVRISASTSTGITDDVRKNGILFECGSHPREWLATESCLAFARHLVDHATDPATNVPELLANADVWIVPLTTPAGRAIDDRSGGDPRRFDTSVDNAGWRGNGDTRGGCAFGVNVARNFSTGWTSTAATDCTDDRDGTGDDPPGGGNDDRLSNYRGFAPFSTLEAVALRQFVQNHTISMAVVVHTNATQIWNLWGATDSGGSTVRLAAAFLWDLGLDDARLSLAQTSVGRGLGQFSAWLSSPSNTAGQPDSGTKRSIQTIFVELPIKGAIYDDTPYRFANGDGSNGFHPSSAEVDSLVRRFVRMAEQLVYETRSPGCSSIGGCPSRDFGLVGAKVGRSSLGTGAIQTDSAGCVSGGVVNGLCTGTLVPARDYVGSGTYYLDFRVQNFSSASGNDDVDVRVTVDGTRADGTALPRARETLRFADLGRREARSGRFTLDLSSVGTDYAVTLEVRPFNGSSDGFSTNNSKVFKVRAR